MSDVQPNFEAFTNKGGRIVTEKTASLTMNNHAHLNVPGKVQEQIFDGAEYIEFHADHRQDLLGLEPHHADDAPPHAYKIGNDVGESGAVTVEKVLDWLGKERPAEHTMFELLFDDEIGMPYIDVSGLEDVDNE